MKVRHARLIRNAIFAARLRVIQEIRLGYLLDWPEGFPPLWETAYARTYYRRFPVLPNAVQALAALRDAALADPDMFDPGEGCCGHGCRCS